MPTTRSVSAAPRDFRVDLDDGTRDRDSRRTRDFGVERLVEARARPAHFEIGIAGEHPHALPELVDRRLVDELDGEAQRDTERDRQDRERRSHAVLCERSPKDRARRRQESRVRDHFAASSIVARSGVIMIVVLPSRADRRAKA